MNLDTGESANESPCPACGEMVRHGLVRCSSCRMIMDPKLREKAAASTATQVAEFAPLPEAEPEDLRAAELPEIDTSGFFDDDDEPPAFEGDDDDDFVLGDGIDVGEFEGDMAAAGPAVEEPTESADDEAQDEDEPLTLKSEEKPTPPAPVDVEPDEEPAADTSAVAADADDTAPDAAAHSDATAGDMLLKMAVAEERKTGRIKHRMDPRRIKGGYMLNCVCGAKVRVREAHVGRIIPCPTRQCWAYLRVPHDLPKRLPDPERDKLIEAPKGGAESIVAADVEAGPFKHRLGELTWHMLVPDSVKQKPGSLAKDGRPADLYCGEDGMLLVSAVGAGGGLFGGKKEKPDAVRERTVAHFADGKPLSELEVPGSREIGPAALRLMQVEYPTDDTDGARFSGVPVFGEGRIVVRLPADDDEDAIPFLSMTLSQFRVFSKYVAVAGGPRPFGGDAPIPLEDAAETQKCHYTEAEFETVPRAEFHIADPLYASETVGYQCAGCGLTVSEDGRKKEKIGGPAGKGLEKAICPKCGKKFGRLPLVSATFSPPEAEG